MWLTATDAGLAACFFGIAIDRIEPFRSAFAVPPVRAMRKPLMQDVARESSAPPRRVRMAAFTRQCRWRAAVAGDLPGGRSGGEPRAPRRASEGGLRAGPTGHWFPLLLFGGLAALSLPLSVLFSPRLPTGMAVFTRQVYPTVAQAMYLGGGSSAGPYPFPLGWYWVCLLVTGPLLTAAWYRWRDRRAGSRTPLRGYLAAGLALAAAAAALPSVAWGARTDGPGAGAWAWLDAAWRLGTFALLAVAAGLWILARAGRSRALAVITLIYTATVCLAGWLDLQQAAGLPAPYPYADPAALLPAAVLLVAGLGAITAKGLRALP